MVNIIIIDDHTVLKDTLSDLLNGLQDFNVVATGSDAKDSVSLCEQYNPDVVLMDVCTANNSSGITYGGIIKKTFPKTKVIAMTGMLDITFIKEARNVNIDSFIYKNISKEDLIASIRHTLNGYSIYPDKRINPTTEKNILKDLTDKEMEILSAYCKLLDRDLVAEKLDISKSTLKTYVASIYQKTGFDNLTKLAIYCVSNGYIVTTLDEPQKK